MGIISGGMVLEKKKKKASENLPRVGLPSQNSLM